MPVKRLPGLIAASALMLPSAFAQQAVQDGQRMDPPPSAGLERRIDAELQMQGAFIVAQTPGHRLGTEVLGADAVTSGGENVGRIEDFLLDAHHRVVGFVISTDGFLGIGERVIAVPLHATTIVPARAAQDTGLLDGGLFAEPAGHVVLDMSADEIEDAPQFVALQETLPVDDGAPGSANQTPARELQSD